MAVPFRPIESDLPTGWIFLALLVGWLLLMFFLKIIRLRRNRKVLKYVHESCRLGLEIASWIKHNVKDGAPIEVLNGPEITVLYQRDQELYDKIIKLYPEWKKNQVPPLEMHKHLFEIAQGKYKKSH